MIRFGAIAAVSATTLLAVGCAPRAVRGDDVKGLDDEAMSTGLDKRDLEKMLHESMEALQSSAAVKRWEKEDSPAVGVLPLRNETSEHVDSALRALVSDIETTLVNAGHVRVVSLENQTALLDEVARQSTDGYNPADVSRWGKQIGARYIVTGKVFSADERQRKERRVQYFLFIQILEVETGAIVFQHKSSVTKAMI
jgi:uncharacterized protein (TIGR02722 family)